MSAGRNTHASLEVFALTDDDRCDQTVLLEHTNERKTNLGDDTAISEREEHFLPRYIHSRLVFYVMMMMQWA